MLEKLQGAKTYIFLVLAFVWTVIFLKVPDARVTIGLDNFGAVFAFLLTGAGVSLKAGHARLEGQVADLRDDVKPKECP